MRSDDQESVVAESESAPVSVLAPSEEAIRWCAAYAKMLDAQRGVDTAIISAGPYGSDEQWTRVAVAQRVADEAARVERAAWEAADRVGVGAAEDMWDPVLAGEENGDRDEQ